MFLLKSGPGDHTIEGWDISLAVQFNTAVTPSFKFNDEFPSGLTIPMTSKNEKQYL